MTNDPIDSICINTIRTLSMDAAQKASSGHPGTPMAMAPVLYVKALAAPHTVNTMPEKTLLALADHGEIGAMLPHDRGDAGRALGALTRAGIDVDRLAADLQREGAAAFVKSWDALLACIERVVHNGIEYGLMAAYQFTHAADFMARIVIQNALFKGRSKSTSLVMPWCTYTTPEVAQLLNKWLTWTR